MVGAICDERMDEAGLEFIYTIHAEDGCYEVLESSVCAQCQCPFSRHTGGTLGPCWDCGYEYCDGFLLSLLPSIASIIDGGFE